jgi:hypothetical protein
MERNDDHEKDMKRDESRMVGGEEMTTLCNNKTWKRIEDTPEHPVIVYDEQGEGHLNYRYVHEYVRRLSSVPQYPMRRREREFTSLLPTHGIAHDFKGMALKMRAMKRHKSLYRSIKTIDIAYRFAILDDVTRSRTISRTIF